MKYLIFSVLFSIAGFLVLGNTPINFQNDFYKALSSENLDNINAQLSAIKSSAIVNKDAYEGALLMRKAGLIKGAKEKLDMFKKGRLKLETSISKNDDNIEYYFLRLIIQENAPKMLKYRGNIGADSQLIREKFSNLSASLQQVILDYNKRSKALKLS